MTNFTKADLSLIWKKKTLRNPPKLIFAKVNPLITYCHIILQISIKVTFAFIKDNDVVTVSWELFFLLFIALLGEHISSA